MRYMVMMQATHADWQALRSLPREDLDAHIAFIEEVDRQLAVSGELVSEQGLCGPDHARLVRGQAAGGLTTLAFSTEKEFLVGYWVLDCDSVERVRQVAAMISACPGRGGVPLGCPIEVRPLMRGPGQEM
jgi:hypothetical protein